MTSGEWKQNSLTFTVSGATLDLFALQAACDKDDLTKFNADRTVTFKTGAIKCTPTEMDYNGTWVLTSNDTKLTVTDPQETGPGGTNFDVVELTASRLSLRGTVSDSTLGAGTVNVVFTK